MTNSLNSTTSVYSSNKTHYLLKLKETRDKDNRRISIWKTSSNSLIGIVLFSSGKVIVLKQSQIINPLQGTLSSEVFDRIYNNPNVHIIYDPCGNKIAVWPHLVASANPHNLIFSGDRAPLPFTDNPNNLRHIFVRNRVMDGHFAQDTSDARRYIQSATTNEKYYQGRDKHGNDHYKRTMPDGRQAWAIVRGGKINNGGMNLIPKSWDHIEQKSVVTRALTYQPKDGDFKDRVQLNNLVDSYNASHPRHPMASKGMVGGHIGGVGNTVGVILGLFDDLSSQVEGEHAFFAPAIDGTFSLGLDEMHQILHELAVGIYVHDTVPFFSLSFNGDLHMYPVIHPAYEATMVGHVIGMLDYYMKGFLNGGYFDAGFVESWNSGSRKDERQYRSKMIDMKSCVLQNLGTECQYHSVAELIKLLEMSDQAEGIGADEPVILKDYSGFRSSFRIISKQNSIKKTENLFVLDADFDVLYTIFPDPEYERELSRYRQLNGCNPPSYQRLEKAYKQMARDVKEIMPRLPQFKKLFEAIHLINFFCYYYTTLKEANKLPLLPRNTLDQNIKCPSMFPHLPIREFSSELISVDPKVMFTTLNSREKAAVGRAISSGDVTDTVVGYVTNAIENRVKRFAKFPIEDVTTIKEQAKQYSKSLLGRFAEMFGEVKKERFQEIDRLIAEWEGKRKEFAPVSSWFQGTLIQLGDANKAKWMKDNLEICDKNLSGFKNQREEFLNNPFEGFRDGVKLDFTFMHSVVHPYHEQKDDEKRGEQKRIVGGCGVHLERKSVGITPIAYPILDKLYGQLSTLSDESAIRTSSADHGLMPGVLFKVGFEDLPQHMEESKQVARAYLCKPASDVTDETLSVFHALATRDDVLLKKAGDSIRNWSFSDGVGISPLHYAASSGSLESLKYLSKKIRSSTTDAQGYNALHYAAASGHYCGVKHLLCAAPGLVQSEAKGGVSPLLSAVQSGDLRTVEALIAAGSDSNAKTAQGLTPLMCAMHRGFENVALVLANISGLDLLHTLDDKTTLLHLAVIANMPRVASRLVTLGCPVNAQRWDGYAPLHLAAERGFVGLVELLAGAPQINLNITLQSGKTPLHLAAAVDRYEVIEQLLSSGADPKLVGWDKRTPLTTAVYHGSVNSALKLLSAMKNQCRSALHLKDASGETALSLAANCKMLDLWFCLFDPLVDSVSETGFNANRHFEWLCRSGVDTLIITKFMKRYNRNSKEYFEIGLVSASNGGHTAAVSMFLDKVPLAGLSKRTKESIFAEGAKFDHINLFAEGFSHVENSTGLAVRLSRNGSHRSLKLLLESMGTKKALLACGRNALLNAVRYGKARCVEVVLHKIFDANIKLDDDKNKAVHIAAACDDAEMLDLLFRRGAVFDCRDNEGLTPFHIAVKLDCKKSLKYLLDPMKELVIPTDLLHYAAKVASSEVLSLVLESDPSLDVVDLLTGETPLTASIRENKLESVVLLCAKGAVLSVCNSRGETPFLVAAKYSVEILEFFLQYDHSDQTTPDGQSALHLAVGEGNEAVVELLVNRGMDSQVCDNKGQTPLQLALTKEATNIKEILMGNSLRLESRKSEIIRSLRNGNKEQFMNLTQGFPLNQTMKFSIPLVGTIELPLLHCIFLLEANGSGEGRILKQFSQLRGVNCNIVNSDGQTILHLAAQKDVDLPLSELDFLTKDKAGVTPLHLYATSSSKLRFGQVLDKVGSGNINVVDALGRTPLFFAIEKNRLDNVLLLLKQGAKVSKVTEKLQTTAGLATEKNFLPILKALKDKGVSLTLTSGRERETCLHIAVRKNLVEVVRWLVPHINVSSQDRNGRQPVHLAAATGNVELVRFLSACGASLFALDGNKNSLMYYAAQSKSAELIDYLAVRDVPLNPLPQDQESAVDIDTPPFHIAAFRGDMVMLSQFSEHGADLSVVDKDGDSALYYAAASGNAQVLEAFTKSPLMSDHAQVMKAIRQIIRDDSIDLLKLLLEHISNINERIDLQSGSTLLHFACGAGAIRSVEFLIQEGAMVMMSDYEGNQAFDYAVLGDKVHVARFLATKFIVGINKSLKDGRSLLHVASSKGNISMMSLLVSNGACVDVPDSGGKTSLHIAVVNGHRRAVRFLIACGAQCDQMSRFTHDSSILSLVTEHSGKQQAEGVHTAARLGDIEALITLAMTEDVYALDRLGMTPWHLALQNKNMPFLRKLASLAPNVEVKDGKGRTPLAYAALVLMDERLVQFLLDLGADPKTSIGRASLLQSITESGSSQDMQKLFSSIYNAIPTNEQKNRLVKESVEKGDVSQLLHAVISGGKIVDTHLYAARPPHNMVVALLKWFDFNLAAGLKSKYESDDKAVFVRLVKSAADKKRASFKLSATQVTEVLREGGPQAIFKLGSIGISLEGQVMLEAGVMGRNLYAIHCSLWLGCSSNIRQAALGLAAERCFPEGVLALLPEGFNENSLTIEEKSLVLIAKSQYQLAFSELNNKIENDPYHIGALRVRALLYLRLGAMERAKRDLVDIKQRLPQDPFVLEMYAKLEQQV